MRGGEDEVTVDDPEDTEKVSQAHREFLQALPENAQRFLVFALAARQRSDISSARGRWHTVRNFIPFALNTHLL